MTLFDRIFGKKQTAAEPIERPADTSIAKELFIEERDLLELSGGAQKPGPEAAPTVLAALLARDYFSIGQKDGYEEYVLEVMDERIALIAAGFREAYYREKADLLERMDQVKLALTPKAKEVMPDQYARIEKQLEYLERRMEDILLQIDLASCGEGYIEQSVRAYKAGFRKGFTLRLDEDVLFRDHKIL